MSWKQTLCWTLCLGIVTLGCRAPVTSKAHLRPAEAASIKVWAFWIGDDGGKHTVAGLEVQLFRPGSFEPVASQRTQVDRHVIFTHLAPGTYTVQVLAQEQVQLRYDVEAVEQQMVTVRIDVKAVEAAQRDPSAPEHFGSGGSSLLEDIFVVIGGAILLLTVVGLLVILDGLDDDDDCHHRHPCNCD